MLFMPTALPLDLYDYTYIQKFEIQHPAFQPA